MKLNNKVLFLAILVIFFGGIGTARALNVWESKPMVVAKTIDSSFDQVVAAKADPGYMSGTNTFAEISQTYNIPLEDLKTAFALSTMSNFAELKARDLKTQYAKLGENIVVETESVRIFAAIYTNVKYYYSDAARLPESAVKVLKEKIKLTPEQTAYLDTHMVKVP